jgi:hypothetical protein
MKTEPKKNEPSLGLLMSMAIRYDHALGCPGYYDSSPFRTIGATHKQRLESALGTMRQLWEEVSGSGFYSIDKDEQYASMAREILGDV